MMKAPAEWPEPKYECERCCDLKVLYYIDRSEPCYECVDFVEEITEVGFGKTFHTTGNPLTPESDDLSDRYHIVESLIALRNELAEDDEYDTRMIVYKINSCLFNEYPIGQTNED